jgi:hypothetical protein
MAQHDKESKPWWLLEFQISWAVRSESIQLNDCREEVAKAETMNLF